MVMVMVMVRRRRRNYIDINDPVDMFPCGPENADDSNHETVLPTSIATEGNQPQRIKGSQSK